MKAIFLYPPKPNSSGISPYEPGFQDIVKINDNYVMELKIDGWAAEVIIDDNGNYHYYNRHKGLINTSFIKEAIKEFEKLKIPKNTILGFEAVGNRSLKVKDMMTFYGGKLMNMISYEENKALLKKIITPSKRIKVLDHYSLKDCKGNFINKLEELLKENKEIDEVIEGIILKDKTKPIKASFLNSKVLHYWVKFRFNNSKRKS